MRIIVKGYSVIGDTDEIVELLGKLPSVETGDKPKTVKIPVQYLNDTVKESEQLRKEIAKNPSYVPTYPTVIPSTEPVYSGVTQENTSDTSVTYRSDMDTGVQYGN